MSPINYRLTYQDKLDEYLSIWYAHQLTHKQKMYFLRKQIRWTVQNKYLR